MKTYSEIRMTNKDCLFLVNDKGNTFKLIMRYNSISDTYSGVELQLWDDSFNYLKNNLWVLESYPDVRQSLKDNGFIEIEPSKLHKLLYV